MSNYQTPYQALGEDGIRAICDAFYDILDKLPEAVEAEVKEMLKVPLYRVADAVRNRQQSITNDNPDVIAIG